MTLLILGLALWSAAHLFKRVAPERRAAMGEKAAPPVALALLAGIILMVIGFRMTDSAELWGRHPATVGINNLLTLFAIYLFAVSGMKTWLSSKIRHPQLTAVKSWAIAHLLVNGDMPGFVLFGGMLAWAVAEVILINRQTTWTRPTGPFPARKELIAAVATLVLYSAIVWVHYWLGYPTFG